MSAWASVPIASRSSASFRYADRALTVHEVQVDWKDPARGIQRRRDRDHHHDHGARTEGAARGNVRVAAAALADLPYLRSELRLRRHLLEQPPPHAAHGKSRVRKRAVGQSAPALLAVAVSVRNGLDGREPLRPRAHGRLWTGAADGSRRVLAVAPDDSRPPGPGPDTEARGRR